MPQALQKKRAVEFYFSRSLGQSTISSIVRLVLFVAVKTSSKDQGVLRKQK